jgi:hypothetical protein
LHSWFGIAQGKILVLILGSLILMAPLVRISQWQRRSYRRLFLASVLIWMVIFNHKAESPTFVIAMAGTALYFVYSSRTTTDIILLTFALVFTSFSTSDIFPVFIRKNYFLPFVVKAIPMILLWSKIQWDLWKSD